MEMLQFSGIFSQNTDLKMLIDTHSFSVLKFRCTVQTFKCSLDGCTEPFTPDVVSGLHNWQYLLKILLEMRLQVIKPG